MRVGFIGIEIHHELRALGHGADSGFLEMLAEMVRGNVRQGTELYSDAGDFGRALLCGEHRDFSHEVFDE